MIKTLKITRCAICGRELSDPMSVFRGIGPDCLTKLNTNEALEFFEKIGLPCKKFENCKNCPYASEIPCPRHRVYVKNDIYPLYAKKERYCSFCGKLANGVLTQRVYKSKIVLECPECKVKNKAWRNQP